MMTTGASATGIANIAMDGTVLDTWYPNPQLDDTVTESGTRRLGAQDLTPEDQCHHHRDQGDGPDDGDDRQVSTRQSDDFQRNRKCGHVSS